MKQWSIITFYFNYFFLFLMSKKSFLENKVFLSIGVGGSLWSLANIKCVAANITRGVDGCHSACCSCYSVWYDQHFQQFA